MNRTRERGGGGRIGCGASEWRMNNKRIGELEVVEDGVGGW